MPYSLVLHCIAQHDALARDDLQGQKALALFLQELIQKQNPALASTLHAPKNSKPFTTAILRPLQGTGLQGAAGRQRSRRSEPGSSEPGELRIRLTLLDDALYPLISQYLLQHMGGVPTLHLGGSALGVSRVTVTPESGEPWAGFARFETLLAQASEAETS
jgi:hypothetical protein